jgi:low temperature requirement protein LtrA
MRQRANGYGLRWHKCVCVCRQKDLGYQEPSMCAKAREPLWIVVLFRFTFLHSIAPLFDPTRARVSVLYIALLVWLLLPVLLWSKLTTDIPSRCWNVVAREGVLARRIK